MFLKIIELQGQEMPTPGGRAIMCAYKLCRVEFRYWGMQSKIERWGQGLCHVDSFSSKPNN